jgi:hypothetical protein
MNKIYSLIAILALLAVAGFTLFFINQQRLAEQEDAMNAQIEGINREQEQILLIQERLLQEQRESEQMAAQAREAQAMAEAAAEKERLERERLVAALNEQLQQEASERREAEAAQAELTAKIAAMEAAQAEAQASLAALESEGAAGAEAQGLKATVEKQNQELLALSQENQALKERQQLLEQRQIATEEAIVSAGGKIDIPYPEVRSPNIKRREALYFKERVLGNPGD